MTTTTPKETAIRQFEECWIDADHNREALEYMNLAHRMSGSSPLNFVVVGKPGTGKTSLCSNVKSLIPKIEVGELTTRPVVHVQMVSGATVPDLIKQLLKELNQNKTRGLLRDDQKDLLFAQLKCCETKLILLDEFQQLVRRNNRGFNDRVCDFIKELSRETRISIGLIGVPKGLKLLELDEHLTNRFSSPITLRELDLRSGVTFQYFQEFLVQLLEQYPLKTSKLSTDDNAARLWMASKGNLRTLKKILIVAANLFYEPKYHPITIEEIGIAYSFVEKNPQFFGANGHPVHPFGSTIQTVRRYLHDNAGIK
jgi:Cdc6-like AAA superfamily ATPase